MMDVSKLNTSKYLNHSKINNPLISFKGHKVENGKIKFFIPGAENSNARVNYVSADGKGPVESKQLQYKDGMLVTEVNMNRPDERLAYNFTVDAETQVDLTEQKLINNEKYALTRDPQLVSFEKPHQIYHILPDSYNPKDQSKIFDKEGNFIWRNHFDLYGGNIEGIIEKLDDIKATGAGRVMGTPVFGADSISCHGYWTENPYQITPRMGNVDTFDELNIKLFQKGMGWIADGAFVNQGLMGVQFQDMLRRATKKFDPSPFNPPEKDNKWFIVYNEPGDGLVIGISPQSDTGENIEDAYDIKFINAPVDRYNKKNNDYNPLKPTYIELYDPRKSKHEEGVRSSFDSVQNYKFPVDPIELKEKVRRGNRDEHGRLEKAELLEWRNFALSTSDYAAGIHLWDGSRDVLKMNMKNPEVRKYIMGAGDFWTTKVDNTLLKYITQSINEELAGKDINADNIKEAIKHLEETGRLPVGASELSEADIKTAMENNDIAKLQDTLIGAIYAYPLEAIEFPTEITAILSNPQFKRDLEEQIYAGSKFEKVINTILNSNKLTEENKEKLCQPGIFRLISQDLAKSIIVKAISGLDLLPGEQLPEDWNSKLAEASFDNLPASIFQETADVASDSLINTIKDGLSKINTDKIALKLNAIVEKTNVPTVRVAKALLNKMEAGLDWRIDAAKDVADMDAVRNGKLDIKEAFNFVTDFWSEFCGVVRKINPNAYIIGEVTDVGDKELAGLLTGKAFSTLSNFRYMFGPPYKFVHAHPEATGWHNGPTAFFNELEEFLTAWPVTSVNTAHNMLDNQDKARVLHNLLLHPGDFNEQGKGPAYAMAAVLKYALCKVYNINNDDNTLETNKTTNSDFAKVYSAIEQTAQTEGKIFGYWPLPRAIAEVMNRAAVNDKTIGDSISKVLFDEMTDKYLRALYVMVGCPGAPEMYAGTEFGMTGSETVTKNVYAQNRNPLPWIWLSGINAKPEVQEFNNKVKRIFSLRNNPNLKVLNNGFVKDLGIKDEDNGVLAFLRYNESQQALVIINNGKVDKSGNAANIDNYNSAKKQLLGNLPVTQPVINNYKLDLTNSGIEIGTEFVDGESGSNTYVVCPDGILRNKSEPNSEGITIREGLILYRKNVVRDKSNTKPSTNAIESLNKVV